MRTLLSRCISIGEWSFIRDRLSCTIDFTEHVTCVIMMLSHLKSVKNCMSTKINLIYPSKGFVFICQQPGTIVRAILLAELQTKKFK